MTVSRFDMNTLALYLDDMELMEFEAEVTSVKDGKYITLDRTSFYPKSGGVACDVGTLARGSDVFDVVYVGKFGGEISHEVSTEGLRAGDAVTGKLDRKRRCTLMRYHTAAHVLSGVFFKNSTAKITGNNITVDEGRIDFNIDEFDRGLIEEYVEKSNEVIEMDLPVVAYGITRGELDEDPNLLKLASGIPPDITDVRVIDIQGFDRQPDGGCHVSSLSEIGRIKLGKIVNKGKNNRRLYFTLD